MIRRFTTTIGVIAGLGALALGGSAIATAGTTSPSALAKPAATTTDTGPNVQQGDQTSPDPGTSAAETAKASSAAEPTTAENAPESAGSATDPAGGPNSGAEQQGQNEGQF